MPRLEWSGWNWSIPWWLIMPWLLVSLGHQQPLYWKCMRDIFLASVRDIYDRKQKQMYFHISSYKIHMTGVRYLQNVVYIFAQLLSVDNQQSVLVSLRLALPRTNVCTWLNWANNYQPPNVDPSGAGPIHIYRTYIWSSLCLQMALHLMVLGHQQTQ